jgi:branched-chain amino acid aminotransferase
MVDTIKIEKRLQTGSRLPSVDFSNIPFGRVYSDHMFQAEYLEDEWRQLRIEPYAHLQLLPGTTALHYGQSIFEGLKAYKTVQGEIAVFRPEMNARRFNISAERMCIPPVPEELFLGAMTELLRIDRDWVPALPGTSLYIRPYAFACDEYIGLRPSSQFRFIIFTCPVGSYYSKPVKVRIETHYSRTVEGGTGYAKAAGNYAASLYPARLAQQEGYDQLIWTDAKTHQYIEEAGTMNIMFVIGDTLLTAETGDTVLKGITRDSVLALAREWGMKVEVRKVAVQEVVEAIRAGTLVEAFGTGTAATVTSISLISYQGSDYELPPVGAQCFSQRVLRELDDIRLGRIEDRHGWMYRI